MDFANVASKVAMKRKWNWSIWVGFVIAVGGLFSYEWFAQFPVTPDFPWANLLLFGIGAVLLIVGLHFYSSHFSATKFFTCCDRFLLRVARPALGNWHRTFYYWIKMESPSASAICSGDSRDRRRSR